MKYKPFYTVHDLDRGTMVSYQYESLNLHQFLILNL